MIDRRHRRLYGLMMFVCFVSLLVAREAGGVDLSLCYSRLRTNHTFEFTNTQRLAERDVKVEIRVGEQRASHSVSHPSSMELLEVSGELTSFDPSRLGWVPLFKTGTCTYEVRFTSSDPEIGGSLTGTLELQAFGFLSARAYRERVHETVCIQALTAITNSCTQAAARRP